MQFVNNNSNLLFKHIGKNTLNAIFDNRGFKFEDAAQIAYDKVKNQPHLYVAWTKQSSGIKNHFLKSKKMTCWGFLTNVN